jgi:hypothetical protein
MAGARPSAFRKGGGFLNDVDGKITGYEFTTEFPGGSKKRKHSSFNSLYCVLSVLVDGADEDVQTTFFVGSADDWEISDDGHTLTPVEDGANLGGNIGWGLFLSTLVTNGFPEDDLPEDEVNFEAIIGYRVRFVQQVNERSTAKAGKRKDKKTGREYDRTDVVVSRVYGPEETATKKAVKSAAQKSLTPATQKAVKAVKKPNGKIQPEEEDLTEAGDELMLEILGDKDGEIKRKSLSIEATKRRMKDPNRDALRELIYSDEYLAGATERGLIEFNQKTQTITAA